MGGWLPTQDLVYRYNLIVGVMVVIGIIHTVQSEHEIMLINYGICMYRESGLLPLLSFWAVSEAVDS